MEDSDYSDPSVERLDADERNHLTMSVTVNVEDMDPDDIERLARLAQMYEDSFMEVVEKNRDYSWSFLRTGEKLADHPSIPLDSTVRSQVFGLLTRSGDKRERFIENVFGNGDSSVSDPPHTTARENANYWLFMALILEDPELCGALPSVR